MLVKFLTGLVLAASSLLGHAAPVLVGPGQPVPENVCKEGCVILDEQALLELQLVIRAAVDAAFKEGASQKGLTCLRKS